MRKIFLLCIAVLSLWTACTTAPAAQQLPKKDIALQLYSLREDFSKDFDAAIKATGDAGYTAIEAANYGDGKFYGKTPEDFKAAVEAAGMKVRSSHTTKTLSEKELRTKDFSESLAWWDKAIDAHVAAGMQYIVAPGMNMPKTLADLQTYCDYYNVIGQKCKEKGLSFGYHNHAYEYVKIEDVLMYDYMLEHTNPDLVFFQMDVYWTVMAQQSPVEYFQKYPGRFTLLHIKDRKELGQSGMVGFDAIFKNTDVAGTKHLIVEVEQYNYTPVESVKVSLEYLLNCPLVKESYAVER
ncbi:MAG: sugar phosphate isomerase/epimerase [Dysgonamonadaceae bacterium]|jgi:sugar phosphate isomerase/epimerase|nr:sugar phosphate isomerase/epimerase [Dysgonamonadaceae bacterium]